MDVLSWKEINSREVELLLYKLGHPPCSGGFSFLSMCTTSAPSPNYLREERRISGLVVSEQFVLVGSIIDRVKAKMLGGCEYAFIKKYSSKPV